MRHPSRHVDFELSRPTTPVLFQPFPIADFETARVQTLVFRLGYEDFGRVARIDTRLFEQEPEVKQIPALHALHDTPQLFSGYLCERIHRNGVRLRQIRPAAIEE